VKLDSAAVMLGPLQPNAEMRGESFTRKDGTAVNRFPLDEGNAPESEKWMACSYEGRVFQAIKLPITTKECSVVYRPEKGAKGKKANYVVSDITCK